MIKVGLSGNRYSGKDTIAKLFKQISIPVFHADIILKFIISRDLATIQEIKEQVGGHIFFSGDIDKNRVTDLEFEKILKVSTTHLMKAYDAFNEKNKKSIYSIFHSSFLFETDWADKMDYNINVFTPKIHRIERCKHLTNMSVTDITKMLKTEMDDLDKNSMSTYIIHNYENMDILNQVNKIDQKIIDLYLREEHKYSNLSLVL